MDDASRRALRDLARRAEWRGHAGAAGAAQDADALRELGGELRAALLREPDQDASAWGYQAAERLSAYCLKARADWTPEQVAELARLREDAVIALAPGPGESDALPPRARPGLQNLIASRQARLVALVTAGAVVLVVLLLLLPHFLSGNDSTQSVASATSSAAAAPTTSAAAVPTTATSTTTSSTTAVAPSTPVSTSPAATATTPGSTAHVTAIQITNTDNVPGNPPEVILTYSVTTSGTGDALLYITVDGSVPTALASMEPIDESGQTTYSDLTQTIDLSQWCGKTVKVAITAGSVSQSVSVPVSGC